jgi:hypothetical protein
MIGRYDIILKRIDANVKLLLEMEKKLMATAQDVLTAVQGETTVEQSVIALLDQISAMLQAAKTDPSVLDQVVSLVTSNKQALADAVTRNTPSA